MLSSRKAWKVLSAFVCAVLSATLLSWAPASAHGGGAEFLYIATDAYIEQRIQEVTDTNDVLLAMEFETNVNGTVAGVRICLDLTQQEVAQRLPLQGYLWAADGTLLTTGGASEGISFSAPCFYEIFFGTQVRVTADVRYVVGFWLRGGQYSYVPHGFDSDISNATQGHLGAPSSTNSTVGAGNGLYAYTSVVGPSSPFPVESWENSDYLISPRFIPDAH
ncbi:MAG TPA: DUF4082 domain-containing protein [Candidatus Limnocylindrales bacterium]